MGCGSRKQTTVGCSVALQREQLFLFSDATHLRGKTLLALSGRHRAQLPPFRASGCFQIQTSVQPPETLRMQAI